VHAEGGRVVAASARLRAGVVRNSTTVCVYQSIHLCGMNFGSTIQLLFAHHNISTTLLCKCVAFS
jgi:hypothetical protein